jgi:hypothetical protein
MVTWEYLVKKINTECQVGGDGTIVDSPDGEEILQRRLVECSGGGWELVSFLPVTPARHSEGDPPYQLAVYAVLKRPLES